MKAQVENIDDAPNVFHEAFDRYLRGIGVIFGIHLTFDMYFHQTA